MRRPDVLRDGLEAVRQVRGSRGRMDKIVFSLPKRAEHLAAAKTRHDEQLAQ